MAELKESTTGSYFVSAYPPFSSWTRESVNRFEKKLSCPASDSPNVPLGVYLHIPFCGKRCEFCYYLSYAGKSRGQIDRYLSALSREMELYSRAPAINGRSVDFIYVGGGTPSLLDARQIERLFAELRRNFTIDPTKEITFECAPKSATPEKLKALRDAGVTRISLGVQQLDDRILKANGRIHLVADIERAYAQIQALEFDVVNIDLIVGLIGETEETFFQSLDGVIAMAPQSVTIYQLEIPQNTELFRSIRDGDLAENATASWEIKRDRLSHAFTTLKENGYSPISSYTAARDPEAHAFVYQNFQYKGSDPLGLGAASFSYINGTHQQNIASLEKYVDQIEEGELPLGRAYDLNPEEQFIREFLLQLKLGEIDLKRLLAKHRIKMPRTTLNTLSGFAAEGWLAFDENRVWATPQGLLRIDHLLPEFYLPAHRNIRYS